MDNYTSACKIGFFVGRKFIEHNNKYFSTKMKLDESKSLMGHDSKFIDEIIDTLEIYLNRDFPYEEIDLVFVPNLFFSDSNKRRVVCYAGMCLVDERLISQDTIIDHRDEVHFHIAYAIASNYFGCYLQEESYLDFWIVEGIAQALANIHTIIK